MILLCDIGGSKTRLAVTRDGRDVLGEPVRFDATDDFEVDINRVVEEAKKLAGAESIEGVAGGIAGVLDADRRKLLRSPHKPGWQGKPFVARLETAFGVPVVFENDTAVVGLGEAHAGAGKGYDLVTYMTVSTGVGGVQIAHGRIVERRFGFEPGHQIIDLGGSVCPECAPLLGEVRGELEAYVSGTATEKRFGKKPYEVTDLQTWDEIARWLAIGVHNTIVHWSPDVVVLGGSMVVKKPGIAVEDVRRHLEGVMEIFPEVPDIKEATCGDFGGLFGAMELWKQRKTRNAVIPKENGLAS